MAQPGSNSQSALPVGPTSVTIKSWHRRMYLDQGAARLPFIVIVLQLMADSGQTSAKPIHWNGTSRVSKSCHWCRKKQKTGFKLAKKAKIVKSKVGLSQGSNTELRAKCAEIRAQRLRFPWPRNGSFDATLYMISTHNLRRHSSHMHFFFQAAVCALDLESNPPMLTPKRCRAKARSRPTSFG
ncbi:hypothetical protein SCLCIDRAFT_831188 [Scleroderma citrinum Foug A]|uniref:Uncharacterized protein n=1 Tax=Scleroderma citrinum Foug A TaxID=1036808 RepID=A0A0C3A6L0_9AGAM|nr:hypothetical protein SCLCIDRAFT_831188 [Scleroderma citrinum Foug A]